MGKLLFRNRYFALAWVALTLFSVAAFVGDGGGHEQIDAAAQRLQAQQDMMATPAAGHTFAAEEEPTEEESTEDPEQVLEPSGDDPRFMTGPNGERYRILTEEEAALVNGEVAPEQ